MNGLDEALLREFLDDYYVEADEHLATLRSDLLALEDGVDGPPVERRVLERLFRALHTLKGLSGMVELSDAERVSHALEGALRALRDGQCPLDQGLVDALVRGVKTLEQVIAAHRAGQAGPDPAPILTQLTAFASVVEGRERRVATAALDMDREMQARMRAALERGERAWWFEFTPSKELAARDVGVDEIRARLSQCGEILQAVPMVQEGKGVVFRFLVLGTQDETAFAGWERDGLAWEPYRPPLPTGARASAQSSDETVRLSLAPTNVVRVDLARLDLLMQGISDLVISRARLADRLEAARATMPAGMWEELQQVNADMERHLRDLREGVLCVRMVPIGEVFARMRFVIRDLAREYGRQVRLEVVGQDTEIDKYLVEQMGDPLLHLVRNAISHGIETPDQRQALGKPPEATIALRAATMGDTVLIEVCDDGSGIDRARVASRALQLGLIDADTPLDNSTLLDVLCAPGFSTRDEADRTSGRGVGMSIVRETVQQVGGTLELDTTEGAGTCFRIYLPLTLAIVDALIVTVGGQTFAVPLPAVRQVIEIDSQAITIMEHGEVITYRGDVLPLLRTAQLFGLPARPGRVLYGLVTGSAPSQAAIVVDRLLSQREIVVYPITDPLIQVPGVTGATELGDGRPILILDLAGLARLRWSM